MKYPDYVEARLAHGSLCHVCPLNGQRKVGHDGPVNAEHIVIAEAPGADEENYKKAEGLRYGRPLKGKTGYFFMLRHLAPLKLVELLPGRSPRFPRIGALKVHLMNVIMCRPPGNKIDSKEGKAAILCCANSARWFLNERLKANGNISLHPLGGTALSLIRGERTPIEPYRGRPTGPFTTLQFSYVDNTVIYRYVLRGKKPTQEWWPAIEWFLKRVLVLSRASTKTVEEMRRPMWEVVLDVLLKKQRRLTKISTESSGALIPLMK